MVKNILTVILFIALTCSFVAAEEVMQRDRLVISLIFPTAAGEPMKAPRSIPQPIEVSGQVFLDISPAPSSIRKDRYFVEYFFDDKLIYKTTSFDDAAGSAIGFGYILDTTKFENGRHKVIVNFWDVKGPSAIGAKELIISNKSEE